MALCAPACSVRVARGDDQPASDVDFLVEFEERRTLLDLSGLRLDLEELLEREVDVATPNSLHPQLRESILQQQVHIFVTRSARILLSDILDATELLEQYTAGLGDGAEGRSGSRLPRPADPG